ncbi:hypothetical protein [Halorhodospira halochloris]|uniref:hypothetical protein n=1 Tax=Halorhodospira halochloris TaxID=1052 RepID=UPI001EE890A1|nr:hypothetical protein [Halorhodospira halochloris]MCG5549172.1 hypothetical protein [Halorhodospira halochloris]
MKERICYPGFFYLYADIERPVILIPGLWDQVPLWPRVDLCDSLSARVAPDAGASAMGLRIDAIGLERCEAAGCSVRVSAWRRYTVKPRSALAILAVELPELVA